MCFVAQLGVWSIILLTRADPAGVLPAFRYQAIAPWQLCCRGCSEAAGSAAANSMADDPSENVPRA